MKSSVRGSLLFALVALTVVTPAHAQQRPIDPATAATAATVRRLLDLTGAAKLALQNMEALLPAQRAANPQIPAAFWDGFLAHARRDIPQLVDSLIPIYAGHFTKAELDQLVRFYESPIGRRLAEQQPMILQESVQVGQRWGTAIGRQVGDSLARAKP